MNWVTEYLDHPLLLIAAICIAAPILWHYWQWFFGNIHDFAADVKDAAVPDWYAFLRGRYWEGEWAELKIGAFILLSVSFVAAIYTIAIKIFY
jgi:hypothetical protein